MASAGLSVQHAVPLYWVKTHTHSWTSDEYIRAPIGSVGAEARASNQQGIVVAPQGRIRHRCASNPNGIYET